MGELDGLFIADDADVKKTIGKTIYFGEVLGKHSEVIVDLEEKELTVKTDDQDFIKKLVEILGSHHLSGFNPITQYKDYGAHGNGPEDDEG